MPEFDGTNDSKEGSGYNTQFSIAREEEFRFRPRICLQNFSFGLLTGDSKEYLRSNTAADMFLGI